MGPKGEVRSPFMGLLFTALSFGLYGMWWWWKMQSEVNAFLGTDRMSVIKIFGLSFVTCGFYGLYFMWVDGKAIIREVQAKAGLPEKPPFVCDMLRMQKALNEVWESIPG